MLGLVASPSSILCFTYVCSRVIEDPLQADSKVGTLICWLILVDLGCKTSDTQNWKDWNPGVPHDSEIRNFPLKTLNG